MNKLIFIAALLTVPNATLAAPASVDYPTKPVRLVVPYPPGGATDVVAREVGQRLSEVWNQQVVIDNRAGAGSVIGHNVGAKATADGYTLLLGTSAGLVLNPLLSSKLPYDAAKDFAPVSLVVVSPQLLLVNAQVPATTVKELVALAKARPGQLNYASPGLGSPNHLGGELLKSMAAIDIVHVPYKGGGPAITDLIGGQVQILFNSIPPVLPQVAAGRLKALAVGAAKRSPVIPDVPTVAETLPGFECVTWYGILAPAGTPAAIVAAVNVEIAKMLGVAEIVRRLTAQGVEPEASSPEQLRAKIKSETARWAKVINSARIRIE
jgi:tripartite-type tricarboxylate transporter receptor subunit TctC